jgi:hypothetical protein
VYLQGVPEDGLAAPQAHLQSDQGAQVGKNFGENYDELRAAAVTSSNVWWHAML